MKEKIYKLASVVLPLSVTSIVVFMLLGLGTAMSIAVLITFLSLFVLMYKYW